MITISSNKYTLKVVKGKPEAKAFVFSKKEMLIGSAFAQNDLIINTAGIASQHARIWRANSEYFIQNLCGSRIMVDGGSPLDQNESSELKSGTHIDMGTVGLQFIKGAAKGSGGKITSHYIKMLKDSSNRKIIIGALGLGLLLILIMFAVLGGKNKSGLGSSLTASGIKSIELPAKGKYGYNKNDKEHLDKAVFTFKTDASNVELYYTPGGIDSDKAVSIQLNGQLIGYTPQVKGGWGEATVVRLPKAHLKRGEDNRLVFDNLNNPPQTDQWGVKNVGIQALPSDLCDKGDARRLFDLGDELYREKTISKGNLLSAHQYYCDAVARMQDCGDKGDFFKRVTLKKEDVKQELDTIYNNLKFEYRQSFQVKNYAKCKGILKDILDYIPDESDKRHKEAAKMLEKYSLYTISD